jgi:type VI protein secretion system component Hcp
MSFISNWIANGQGRSSKAGRSRRLMTLGASMMLEDRFLMAANAFLRLDQIPGDSRVNGFVNQIQLSNFQIGASYSIPNAKASLSQLTFNLPSGLTTAEFQNALYTSVPIATGTLTVTQANDPSKVIQIWDLKDIKVFSESSNIDLSANSGSSIDTVSLSFLSATVTTPTAQNGKRFASFDSNASKASISGTYPKADAKATNDSAISLVF